MEKTDIHLAPMFSIIVPVFRAEKHLPLCLDSVKRQTSGDFELILVNDGSDDRSVDIAREALRASSVVHRIIEQPNYGVSVARNTAIDSATGNYLLFLDSDDVLDPDAISDLSAAITIGCDLTVFAMDTIYPNHTHVDAVTELPTGPISVERFLAGRGSSLGFCFKQVCYYRFLVNRVGIRFVPGCKFGEDVEFLTRYVLASDTISAVQSDKAYYHYRIHDANTILGSLESTNINYWQIARRLWSCRESELPNKRTFVENTAYRFMWKFLMTSNFANRFGFHNRHPEVREMFREGKPSQSARKNLEAWMLLRFPQLLVLAFRLFRKSQRII